MRNLRRICGALLALCTAAGTLSACASAASGVRTISLDSQKTDGGWTHSAALDGRAVEEFDYAWHADPSAAHDEVEDAPAEYFTGAEPGDAAVYIAHDLRYFPQLPEEGFTQVNYDGSAEWAYYYTAPEYQDYIFATLPVKGDSVPAEMMHSEADAYENAVLHITEAGTYRLQGSWHGQIWIDLGDGAFDDPEAKVTLILSGVDVTCTAAPALVFRNAYECDNAWEDRETYSAEVDTSGAGAVVVLADGTENRFSGTNVYRMLKTKYKDGQEDAAVPVQKKLRKTDAAFYSYVSMNIEGEGVLNVESGFEGLDTELHLSVNGGTVNITSQDDGVNVNEDGVSVAAFNGGTVHILAGLGGEGDGVDSNGFLAVNGGALISLANPRADSGLDSGCGTYINGGTVLSLGSGMDGADSSGGSGQAVMNLQFAQPVDGAITVTDLDGKVVFAYDPARDAASGNRSCRGAILSCPGLEAGGRYRVYTGGEITGTESAGLYDASTVTGFTGAAMQQGYAGMTGPGPGGERPEGDPPALPEGGKPGGRPERPGDGEPPARPGGEPGGPPEEFAPAGDEAGRDGGTAEFLLEDQASSFSRVSDAPAG